MKAETPLTPPAAPWVPLPPELRFTAAESAAAHQEWKASCGPHSIAAAAGKSLEEVRAALSNYRGWMNPTQVSQALTALGQGFALTKGLETMDLCNGVNRIQWEGPWLGPGKPPSLAYRYTHYVAHHEGLVLCTGCIGHQWIPADDWFRHHLEEDPVTPFHITHHWRLTEIVSTP